MVTKIKKTGGESKDVSGKDVSGKDASRQLAGTVKESAQQIWLAGLGAFSKAQEEGGKVFDALVREGQTLQKRTQSAAEEKLTEATSRMTSMANDLSTRASGQWDKLESIFEDRVARAMKKLGVPSARDIDALVDRIEELQRTVARLQGGSAGRPAAGKRVGTKSVAAKAGAAKTTARKQASARKAAR
jgi:poly(hydroxyalkanoate) granule-associated protein